MKRMLLAAVAALTPAIGLAAPAPKDALRETKEVARELLKPQIIQQNNQAGSFTVPGTEEPGGWVRLCITELRYIAFTTDYVHSGFAKTPGGADYYFGVTKSGIIMSPSSTPVLVPTSEGFAAPETPDLWSFLRVAANEGHWVEFYAWAPDKKGVQRVTQVRRQYPSGESAPCPAS